MMKRMKHPRLYEINTAPWLIHHPEYYVQGSEDDFERNPAALSPIRNKKETLYIAKGKDPFFPPWPDTVQLNYFHPGMRVALWKLDGHLYLVVVNITQEFSQGRIPLQKEIDHDSEYILYDALNNQRYIRKGNDMINGLHIILNGYQSHIFKISLKNEMRR